MQRKFPKKIKRVVIKVGSSVIATFKMKPRVTHLKSLVDQVSALNRKGIEVVIVSSGAIVLGMGEVRKKERPSDLASLQALSAVGQTILMKTYSEFFKANRKKCGQVLLTWDDFNSRTRYVNAGNAFQAMFDMGIVPIVNENDTISTDEIKFGDNDKLSAMVASAIEADLLIILSDVEGLYDLNHAEKKVFDEIKEITGEIESIASGVTGAKKHISKGGMTAKLDAIKIASQASIPCVIAHGEMENVILRILKGEKIGTLFIEKETKLLARKHWISFGARPKGSIMVDDGAVKALVQGGKSLLLPGIISWDGHFKKDDVVVIQDKNKNEIGRGIINYSDRSLDQIEDKKGQTEAIHCDDMVLAQR